jgi:hypothetical protein
MVDDFSTIHSRLKKQHTSTLVLVYDDRTEYFAYWDERPDAIDASALAYLLEQGFEILDAGCEECEVTGQQQGWMEFRRHDPGEVFGDGGSQHVR